MKKILLIEDNPDVRENTGEILQLAGYQVQTAENGKVGLDKCRENKPDLIICDIMMPELDGYGVLHILSKTPETAAIPFIFLSAKAEKADVRKGMSMGADDYLTKPFDDIELLNAIESRLRRHEVFMSEFSRDEKGLNRFMEAARGLRELQEISLERETRSFHKKDFIFEEENTPRYLYFVRKGKIKSFKVNPDGKEYITGLIKEGEFLGYLPLMEGGRYSESAMAMEDSEVTLIPSKDFHDLINRNQEVASKFIRMLSNDLKEQEQRLIELAYNSVRKRVADALVMLHERYSPAAGGTQNVSMAVSREDLAAIVGTAKESVIRVLSDFKDEGLVETRATTITILNLEKLKKLKG